MTTPSTEPMRRGERRRRRAAWALATSYCGHSPGITAVCEEMSERTCIFAQVAGPSLHPPQRGPRTSPRGREANAVGSSFVDKTPANLVLIRGNGEVHPTDDDCRIEGQSWVRRERRTPRAWGTHRHWKADREGLHDRDIASSTAQGSITCVGVEVGKN